MKKGEQRNVCEGKVGKSEEEKTERERERGRG